LLVVYALLAGDLTGVALLGLDVPLVVAFSVHFPHTHRAQVLPLMQTEIAQQFGYHNNSSMGGRERKITY
jgi:hypothetical protein